MTEEQLSTLETDLRRDLEAITRVRQIMAAKEANKKPDERQMPLLVPKAPQTEAADDLDEGSQTTLKGTIERIFNEDPTVRWTTPKMLTHLKSINFPLQAKKPIYSVGQAIQKLYQKDKIRLLRKGEGSRPNVYRGLERPKIESNSTLERALVG